MPALISPKALNRVPALSPSCQVHCPSVDGTFQLASRARALGVLVNVEDVLPLCDFHVPAIVRRGDLLLTASTGGQAPGLSRALRESLAEQFGPEWTARLRDLSKARARWRSEGMTMAEVSQMVRAHVEREGWL